MSFSHLKSHLPIITCLCRAALVNFSAHAASSRLCGICTIDMHGTSCAHSPPSCANIFCQNILTLGRVLRPGRPCLPASLIKMATLVSVRRQSASFYNREFRVGKTASQSGASDFGLQFLSKPHCLRVHTATSWFCGKGICRASARPATGLKPCLCAVVCRFARFFYHRPVIKLQKNHTSLLCRGKYINI